MSDNKNNIVILGAGVAGLTSALLLSQDTTNAITVIAKHMPGDVDIEYCSPWAGANYLPFGTEDSNRGIWERRTWPHLARLAQNVPETGIEFQTATVRRRDKDQNTTTGKWTEELTQPDPWYRTVVPNFANVPRERLEPGVDSANTFTSVCINAAIYLPWLLGQCRKAGVVFRRAVVAHVADAGDWHHTGQKASLVVNCTGLSSLTLGGVEDKTLHPVRGQLVVVRNYLPEMNMISGIDTDNEYRKDSESVYTMTRPAGGGTILGGSYQMDNWDPIPDPDLAKRIMTRCIELCPGLVRPGQGIEGLSVIRHGVGLRPVREDGPRVEEEKVCGMLVVHNYGHGGYGYQTSYGCAETVVELVRQVLSQSRANL
ncbi:D-amino acid oxidase [Sporothrix bragantina]|uniref:D-amino acid oxidase n=1 Tax=Sporothrix bragantina TaxID=671064 RepID=A0ABP0CKH7_9PEZI